MVTRMKSIENVGCSVIVDGRDAADLLGRGSR